MPGFCLCDPAVQSSRGNRVVTGRLSPSENGTGGGPLGPVAGTQALVLVGPATPAAAAAGGGGGSVTSPPPGGGAGGGTITWAHVRDAQQHAWAESGHYK